MKRRRHTPDQIIRKLAEGEKLLGQGQDLEEVARHLEITESTWHRWRNQYGGMKANDAKRLKELQRAERAPQAHRRRPDARQRHAEGVEPGKLLTPDRRRRAVVTLCEQFGVSERTGLPGRRPAPLHAAPSTTRAGRRRARTESVSSGLRKTPSALGLEACSQSGPRRRLGGEQQADPPPLAC